MTALWYIQEFSGIQEQFLLRSRKPKDAAQSEPRIIMAFIVCIKENYRTVLSVLIILPKQSYGCIKISLNTLLVLLQEMNTMLLSKNTKIDQPLSFCKFIFSVDSNNLINFLVPAWTLLPATADRAPRALIFLMAKSISFSLCNTVRSPYVTV